MESKAKIINQNTFGKKFGIYVVSSGNVILGRYFGTIFRDNFFLMIQIHDLRLNLKMVWRLAKDLDLSKF